MLVEERYFSQDKNYLLKSVQAFAKGNLVDRWLQQIFTSYHLQHNPMGLEDDFIIELRKKLHVGKDLLTDNYDILAAIYRRNHSDNQLEIMWDGRSHMEAYDAEWRAKYDFWIGQLSLLKEIQRPVIKYAVSQQGVNHLFLKQSIRRAILNHFELKLQSRHLKNAKAA